MTEPEPSGTERAIFGPWSVERIDAWLAEAVGSLCDSPVAEVIFRSGRVDAVYGLRLHDGRPVAVKVHRPPTDVPGLAASAEGQRLLAQAGYPCPVPIHGPVEMDARTVTVESLLSVGAAGSGHHPGRRRAMAASLSEHIEILRSARRLFDRLGPAPTWVRFERGPWPPPHDTLFDFTPKVAGFEWLDVLAQQAADVLVSDRERLDDPVAGHCDWHAGNLRFEGDRIVAVYDWNLARASAPFLAGLAAANHTSGGTSGDNTPTTDQVTAFLADFDTAAPRTFTARQQQVAAAGATWALCYNARCGLSLMVGDEPPSWSPLAAMADHGRAFLALRW